MLAEVATSLNYVDVDALHTAIGEHHVSAESVVAKIDKLLRGGDPEREEQLSSTIRTRRRVAGEAGASVHVEGLDDVMIRLSRCCTPVPGDEIIGFVTRGRGVSVHRADCANAGSLQTDQADRVIEVEWDEELGGVFVASIEVRGLDRPRLLRDVSSSIADHHVNILGCSMHTGSDRIAAMRFEFEFGDPSHLTAVIGTIRAIDGVYDAYRVVSGSRRLDGKAV